MTVMDFIAVVCFGMTCFSFGYQLGCRDNTKNTKE